MHLSLWNILAMIFVCIRHGETGKYYHFIPYELAGISLQNFIVACYMRNHSMVHVHVYIKNQSTWNLLSTEYRNTIIIRYYVIL